MDDKSQERNARTYALTHRLASGELETRYSQIVSRWVPRLQKSGFAILDQGLFAAANFVVNILLARWLDPAQYGAFATAYSIFLLLGNFHGAILIEPMLVYGPGRYRSWFREYLGFLLYGHAALSVFMSLTLGWAGLILLQFGSVELGQAFLGLVLASPAILLTWLLRRACYVQARPQWAAAGGGLYLVLMIAGIFLVYEAGWLSCQAGLVIMGIAGLFTGGWLAWLLHPRWQPWKAELNAPTVLADHWAYGKWSTATAGLTWLPGNLYYALLPIWVGLEGSAALKAMQNFIMPILLTISALGLVTLPEFVRILSARGRQGLNRHAKSVLVLLLTASVAYWILLAAARVPIINWLYNGQYDSYANLLLFVGLLPLGSSIGTVLGSLLRAYERPDLVFYVYVGTSLMTLTGGLALMAAFNVYGAVGGQILSSLMTGLLMAWFYTRIDGSKTGAAP